MPHAIVSALITDELHVARMEITNDGPYPRHHRQAFNDGSRRKNEDPVLEWVEKHFMGHQRRQLRMQHCNCSGTLQSTSHHVRGRVFRSTTAQRQLQLRNDGCARRLACSTKQPAHTDNSCVRTFFAWKNQGSHSKTTDAIPRTSNRFCEGLTTPHRTTEIGTAHKKEREYVCAAAR